VPQTPSRLDAFPEPSTHVRIATGGTSSQWDTQLADGAEGLRLSELEPAAFEERPGVPGSGWPISRKSLSSVYDRAAAMFGIDCHDSSAARWEGDDTRPVLELGDSIRTHMFQFAASAPFLRATSAAIHHPGVHVYEECLVTQLISDSSGQRVTRAEFVSADGQLSWCEAGAFVLALGALGNARLLMRSQSAHPLGLGNHSDQLGRNFMDHPMSRLAVLRPNDPGLHEHLGLYDLFTHGSDQMWGKLCLSDEVVRSEQLLSTATALFPMHSAPKSEVKRWMNAPAPVDRTFASASARYLAKELRHGQRPSRPLHHLAIAASGPDDLFRAFRHKFAPAHAPHGGFQSPGWHGRSAPEGGFGNIELLTIVEQTPHPDNRVVLTGQLDRFGLPGFRLDWHWSRDDDARLQRVNDRLCEALSDLGEVVRPNQGRTPLVVRGSTHHHSGTTRMSASAEDGVVDVDCRIHGVDNTWVVGSSVFPTVGFANPTLTDVALGIRCADHILSVR